MAQQFWLNLLKAGQRGRRHHHVLPKLVLGSLSVALLELLLEHLELRNLACPRFALMVDDAHDAIAGVESVLQLLLQRHAAFPRVAIALLLRVLDRLGRPSATFVVLFFYYVF